MPDYSPSFSWVLITPTHRGMAQAEFTWVPGSARPETVTLPDTNQCRRRVTTLIETKALW